MCLALSASAVGFGFFTPCHTLDILDIAKKLTVTKYTMYHYKYTSIRYHEW